MDEYWKSLRKLIGHMPIVVCGASVIVENTKGEILLQLRKDNNCWAYPGGLVDVNEVVEEAAMRELTEEAGIVANSLELFGVFSGEELYHVYPHGDEVSIVDVVYTCKDYSGEAKADLIESIDVRFFPIDNLPDNLSPACVPAIRKYSNNRSNAFIVKKANFEHNIQLTVFNDEDLPLFTQWLDKDYIYKWFCCDGNESEQAYIDGQEERQAWLDDITFRAESPHRHLFIVTCDWDKIGFCMCIDVASEPDYMEEQYTDLKGNVKAGEALELNYCIGEEAYLTKGIGKIIIKKLEQECRNLGATLLLADPSEDNVPSVKVLLANGFEKHKDGDYRKQLS